MSTDNGINAVLEEIDGLLEQMPKEERLKYFAAISKPKDMDFVRKVGDTHYVVRSHFDNEKREDLRSKVQRLVMQDR